MSNLSKEPPLPVQSLGELFAIAHRLGQEAGMRYTHIANMMRSEGRKSLAQLFEHLAAEEIGHVDAVTRWSEKQSGKEPDPTSVRWIIPETFEDEGLTTSDPELASVYRSLSIAVRNEERAFAFWTYVAAHAPLPEIRQAAETMANEELRHVAKLRHERRRAYHAERSAAASRDKAGADTSALERRLADLLDAFAGAAEPASAVLLRQLSSQARATADDLSREPLSFPLKSGSRPVPESMTGLAELLVDRYLEAAERVGDQNSMTRAQTLAGNAISRLVSLRKDQARLQHPG